MANKSAYGRTYAKSKPISDDLRHLIVSDLEENGGDVLTGKIPRGQMSKTGRKFKIWSSTVLRIWKKYCHDGNVSPRPHGGGRTRKFSNGDLVLIETILKEKPSTSYNVISEKLQEFSTFAEPVPTQRISDAVRKYLPSGQYTFKRMYRQVGNRYGDANMTYTQAFIDYLSQKDPRKIKYFDESGFNITACHKMYGHSLKGEKCVEIGKFIQDPNITLNFLVSLNGVAYFNLENGPSTTEKFINFWHEAAESVNDQGDRPLLPGDIIVLDNCAIHKNEGERHVSNFLDRMGIEYLFLPTYSPDLNPAENCFQKIKSLLKQERYQYVSNANLKVAVGNAISEITLNEIAGYYRGVNYLHL